MEDETTGMNKSVLQLHMIYVTIIGVLIVSLGAVFYHYHKEENKMRADLIIATAANKADDNKPHMSMVPETPVPLSDVQVKQLALSISKTSTEKTFNISGGNFYFTPNKITVNKGDKVTFILDNKSGFHDVVIDELGLKTATIKTGENVSATFTATKSGSFAYYCDVPKHREKGTVGTLIVQ